MSSVKLFSWFPGRDLAFKHRSQMFNRVDLSGLGRQFQKRNISLV